MDESKSIWNKTTGELTVKDQLLLSVAAPALVVGSMVAFGAAVNAMEAGRDKFRTFRANRKNKAAEQA